ncbi:bifunctional salicylyl-CoA 5-hydroxylase/oxidoreductase [Kibdelosporangium phytohabitans]|uniref:Salicylyl-CoA 5-hydroxylase n=1 Tax=Kibdelosporangium phytohabitans TaxID=860235 RepID=A0A0N9HWC2_9PSEU|nr:bifunctional salicylyl-CoA 5-hydroxylase/oxidoreductase [Kibdelosporangium phytohabitans]ALG07371.1 salicylyl-CoA 5-hydroxylase [Kibdelosporangium phytohabitans]MBE1471752.1 anthraniloyl-CoA monooxygenase [Kibdelosporangium phytohabitans]
MRIAVAGGGPGGLYFAALAKALDPGHEITVWERNAPDDTFGFGVVFSDETLGGIEHADTAVFAAMSEEFARWDDIDVHFRGTTFTSGGHGFAAMSRRRLLGILQQRCLDLGVTIHFRTEVPGDLTGHDLVVAADGANSATRARHAATFKPTVETRRCKYIWLGTDLVFDAFKFHILDTPAGIMQVHGYPYSRDASTFILEMHDDVWERAGFEAAQGLKPGENDEASLAKIRALCADVLDGHSIAGNNSKWTNFATVRCATWQHENVVLIGDAAHTAHFSIGSGTKLAMEDALALAACLHEQPGVAAALAAYEEERRPVVTSTQRAAQASLEWFENIGQYADQEPHQFAFNIVTRSRRVTYDNLRLRDPEFVADLDTWFARDFDAVRPPMFQPFRIGELALANRIVVSPMDMYSAVDGVPGDFHLVHLGSKALGGAGLVMTEMVCVSDTGRITPGCTGMYRPEHEESWKRVVDFVHARSAAKIGIQLGHSGRKGSTKLMWEGIDQPLPEGNWEVCGPSAIPYAPASQTPRELTPHEMAEIKAQFVASARSAARAGFDLLELHCAHGYLLSSFLSPLTNQRTDSYGGSLENRLRYPLEVFDAIREAWPGAMTVRISATDWCEGGIDSDEAVAIARAFAEHGVDGVDVSTGQVVSTERPAYGRSYQTPYADRIRNEVGQKYGVAVIAVGAISSYDDVNSIILAGRADLCALGRTHLYDPHWTLHAAADQEYTGVAWPKPFAAGSRKPRAGRTEDPKPRLNLIRSGEPGTAHARWRG